jgi:hypothetical protein
MGTLKVKTVAGRKLPVSGGLGAYVGYDKKHVDAKHPKTGQDAKRAEFTRSTKTCEVPNTSYYRRAIRRGDIVAATTVTTEKKGK